MSALSEIEAAHARHRAALLAREAAEQRALVASYAKAIREVEGKLAKLAVEIASATENLDPADAAIALRGKRVAQARLEGVLDEMRYEVAKWTDSITPELEALHADAVQRGIDSAETLTRLGLGPPPPGGERIIGQAFASVDHGAVANAVAYSHGGPVAELLASLAGDAATDVAQEMMSAIARGQNPLVTASRIRSKLSVPLYRAQTITRTETLRAYREATREAYQQSNLVKSWVWVAACDSRTCGCCWALHGQEFPTGEKMGTHPRCRCTMAPNTNSWEELTGLRQPGVQETNLAANMEKGPDLFDALPDSTKLEILGPSKFAAYKDGKITLGDLVHVEDNAVWGTTRREASLRSILGDDARNYYPRPGRLPSAPATPPAGGVEFSEKGREAVRGLDAATPDGVGTETLTDAVEDAARRVREQIPDADPTTRFRHPSEYPGSQDAAGWYSSADHDVNLAPPAMDYGSDAGPARWFREQDDAYKRSVMETAARKNAESYVHETGHWIDYEIAKRAGEASGNRLGLNGIIRAVQNYNRGAIGNDELFDAAEAFLSACNNSEWYRRNIVPMLDASASSSWARYLTDPTELFARAFSQYMAEVNPALGAIHAEAYPPNIAREWLFDEDSWPQIRRELERVLRAGGMMR